MTQPARPRPDGGQRAGSSARRTRRRRARLLLVAGVLTVVVGAGVAVGARMSAAQQVAESSPSGTAAPTVPDGPPPGSSQASDEDAPMPGSEGLVPELVARLASAREGAAAAGYTLTITSGHRSPDEQAALVAAAIAEHGSLEAAKHWVAPPETSAHVQGTAVDVGDLAAATWLAEHQRDYGLCLTYENEWWHVEVVGAVGDRCPPMQPDSYADWEGVDTSRWE